MRNLEFAPGEYYHLVNRGVDKKVIFKDDRDYARFLFLILGCQSPLTLDNIGDLIKTFYKNNQFTIKQKLIEKINRERYVELVAFCLMPNHFHLLIKVVKEGGASQYMQRIQNAYTKYFNTRYKLSGHLLQGPFRAVHLEDNEQLLYLSAYIHKNCLQIPRWSQTPEQYPWSSAQDYVYKNRWSNLIKPEIILDQFNKHEDYAQWLNNHPAKDND